MLLFNNHQTDAGYSRWQEPKSEDHDEDGCQQCHLLHCDQEIFVETCEWCESQKCHECNGTGNLNSGEECGQCNGFGWTLEPGKSIGITGTGTTGTGTGTSL